MIAKRFPHKLALASLLCVLLPGRCSQTAPMHLPVRAEAVPASYFGMHIHRADTTTPWPPLQFASLRLWDTGTTWSDIEPRRGEWRFDTLDRLVALADEHRVNVILTFGRTPLWAIAAGATAANDPYRQSSPPAHMADWQEFVTEVATRYKGRIAGYEIWNEPNLREYYDGSPETLVEMTRIASQAIHRVDPGARVLSPSATTTAGLPWLEAFLSAGGGSYVDVIAYHLYVIPDPPERMVALVLAIRELMSRHGVARPLWDTETGWAKPKTFSSDAEQSAYVARALLLAWAAGVDRFYWYAWDNRNWVTLNLSTGDDYRPTLAAASYETTQRWMSGKRIGPCDQSQDGVWSCKVTDGERQSVIFWNPDRETSFRPNINFGGGKLRLSTLDGQSREISETNLRAEIEPALLSAE